MTVPPAVSAGQSGSQVQSVVRAIAVIAAVADSGDGLTLTSLAREVGLSLSTTHRLVQTLCASEILCRGADEERFVAGPLLLRLARASLARSIEDVDTVLGSLTTATGETASYGIRVGDRAVVLAAALPATPLRVHRATGHELALHASALGQALLAYDGAGIDAVVAALPDLAATTPRTVTDRRVLATELSAVRFRRWARADETQDPGVRGLAAPVLGTDGIAGAAVMIEGPLARLPDERAAGIGELLTGAARRLRDVPISLTTVNGTLPRGDGTRM